jgi:hypothetical protein
VLCELGAERNFYPKLKRIDTENLKAQFKVSHGSDPCHDRK